MSRYSVLLVSLSLSLSLLCHLDLSVSLQVISVLLISVSLDVSPLFSVLFSFFSSMRTPLSSLSIFLENLSILLPHPWVFRDNQSDCFLNEFLEDSKLTFFSLTNVLIPYPSSRSLESGFSL